MKTIVFGKKNIIISLYLLNSSFCVSLVLFSRDWKNNSKVDWIILKHKFQLNCLNRIELIIFLIQVPLWLLLPHLESGNLLSFLSWVLESKMYYITIVYEQSFAMWRKHIITYDKYKFLWQLVELP